MKGPESEVKADIKDLLTSLGAWQYMVVPSGYGRRGIPDHIACIPTLITQEMVGRTVGLFAGIEAKAEGKTPDTWQTRELNGIAAAAGIAVVATGPNHLETIREALRALQQQA